MQSSNIDESKKIALKEFMKIPGVGKSIAGDLWDLGYRSNSELVGENPEIMYERFCELVSQRVDLCLKYVFRCAVYYVSNPNPETELLKWWNWKNRTL